MKQVFDFLAALERNNNREWFNDHREEYESARDKILVVNGILMGEIRKFDPEVPLMDPKEALFRIYRDIRFSPDKRPYKTHFGSFFSKGGFKSYRAGYYFHVQPGECYLGGGIWMPPKEVLKALRLAVYDHPEEMRAILEDPGFKKYFTDFDGEKLKKAPAGFPADFPHMDLLRTKSYAVGIHLPDGEFLGDRLLEVSVEVFREVAKLNRFLNEALDQYL